MKMIPVQLKIALLVIGTIALYAAIGQQLPQRELPPTMTIDVDPNATPEQLAELGQFIAEGKGLCRTCHTVGNAGSARFPDLAGIAETAATRVEGLGALQYLAQSIYQPNEYIVPGYDSGMPCASQPPVALSDAEIITLIAYLQSLGGTPTVTVRTTKAELGVE